MSPRLATLLSQLPDLLGGHLTLAVPAIALGVLASVPLGIACVKQPRIRGTVMTAVSLVQTVPSIALLALMVAVLGGTIGFRPAFIALLVYSALPIVRNTIVGLEGVDPAMREAARAVGMRPLQSLLRVELPLAFPVILAGIRTATVWVVGIATLSTPVGAPSLGNYIFSGLQLRDWNRVLFGCVITMLLSLVLDQLLAAVERGVQHRQPKLAWAATAMLGIVLAGGLAPSLLQRSAAGLAAGAAASGTNSERDETIASATPLVGTQLTIGAKGFSEQLILADLLDRRLSAAGGEVEVLGSMGSTILFDALASGTVDACVDYTGTLWSTVLGRNDFPPRDQLRIEMAASLLADHGITTLGPLGFENTYALLVRGDVAEAHGLSSVHDLVPLASELRIGGDPEFFARPEWERVRSRYGLEGCREVGMESTFLYAAVAEGQVDVAVGFSTDGRIDAFNLEVLADPLAAFPPYDAVILLSSHAAAIPAVSEALRPLIGGVPVEVMRMANRTVDQDGKTPAAAAGLIAGRPGGDEASQTAAP